MNESKKLIFIKKNLKININNNNNEIKFNKKNINMRLIVLFIFSCQIFYSQSELKDLRGTLKLNDTAFIPFKLSILKNHLNEIEGYSLTDENGPHETKSYVKGTHDEKSGVLKFYEYGIVYSKSPYDELDFCFVHFEGKMKDFYKSKKIMGNFQGKYDNGSKCIDGEIILLDEGTVNDKIEKFKKKFNKPRFQKNIAKRLPKIDSIQLKPITTDEDLNVFVNSKKLVISIYDSGKVDDDRINLFVDDKLILKDYSIVKERKEIPLEIKRKRISVKVVALNEGTSSPNTVKIEVRSNNDFISTKTTLKTNESASLSLVRK